MLYNTYAFTKCTINNDEKSGLMAFEGMKNPTWI